MNKRIAKKVLKYMHKLNYTESQVLAAARKHKPHLPFAWEAYV